MADRTRLDTDTVSYLLRKETRVVARAADYLADFPQLSISIITRYEILRGLCFKRAISQRATFDAFCRSCEIIALSDDIIVRAADIYASLRSRGMQIGDADILIAATAIEHGFHLATNNVKHYARVSGLTVDNWRG